jgi:hypothetical protein
MEFIFKNARIIVALCKRGHASSAAKKPEVAAQQAIFTASRS